MTQKLLIYGIGNPGREDDGLGYEFVLKLNSESKQFERLHNYQLNIEDAELFSKFDEVLIVDAAKNLKTDFSIDELKAQPKSSFSSHGLAIEAVLAITEEIYNKKPTARLLAIRGSSFDIKLGLTNQANKSLNAALSWCSNSIPGSVAVVSEY